MKQLLLFILISLFCISCSDSFFQKYPNDQINEGLFYNDAKAIEMLVNDAYSSLRAFYVNYFYIGDVAADDAFNQKFNNNSNAISINESNVTLDNGIVLSLWNSAYTAINRTNLALENLEDAALTDQKKNQFKGESLFLRSLLYFDLVRVFGGIPLITNDIKSGDEAFDKNVRATVEQTYDQVISDLTEAIARLELAGFPMEEEMGRATAGAARTLLGKVYLTIGRPTEAMNEFQKVIAYNEYELLPNYEDVFDAANSNNKEIIFAVQYARGFDPSMGNPLVQHAFPNENFITDDVLKLGNGTFLITDDLYNSFEIEDIRKKMINDQLTGKRDRYYFTKKYYDKQMVGKVDSGCDIILLRYADLLLMCAEAEAAMGQTEKAFEYVKTVRDRAGLASPDYMKDNIKMTILKERRAELHCESHRWFDLLRSGELKTVMNAHFASDADNDQIGSDATIEDHELIFPIPKFEIDLSEGKLKQNPGY